MITNKIKQLLLITMLLFNGIMYAATATTQPETTEKKELSRFEQIKAWCKKNPKKAVALGLGTLTIGGFIGYKLLYKSSNQPSTPMHRLIRSFEPLKNQFPIVFAPAYTMGMMWDHYGYDLGKSQKSFDHLKNKFGLTDAQTYQPNPIGDAELAQVHTKEYLKHMTEEDFVKLNVLCNDNGILIESNDGKSIISSRPLINEKLATEYPLLKDFISQKIVLNNKTFFLTPNNEVTKKFGKILPAKTTIKDIDQALLAPMRLQTSGTALAAQLALKHGFAFNLGGGFHHSKPNGSDATGMCANCLYADINLAIEELRKLKPGIKIMVIDLDAHHGNGYAMMKDPKDSMYKKENNDIVLFDVYNIDSDFGSQIAPNRVITDSTGKKFPQTRGGDLHTKQFVDYHYLIRSTTTGPEYLELINKYLPQAIEKAKPDFIIYNAGTDIMRGDRTTGVQEIQPEDIIARDEFVFAQATARNIPIISLFSGGYAPDCADVISASLENVINKFYKDKVDTITKK